MSTLTSGTPAIPTREELDAFFHKTQAYYVDRFVARAERGRYLAGFNWSACLLSVYWMVYRGLWKEAGAMFALEACLFLFLSGPDLAAGFLALRLAVGSFANPYYLGKATRVIRAVRGEEYSEPEQLLAAIKTRGGTHEQAFWTVVLGVTAAHVAATLIGG